MSVDPRIIVLVEKAKAIHPKIFGGEGKNISANKGPNGETGYSIFHNKGKGYSYAIVAINGCLYMCFQVSASAQNNKAAKVSEFYNKFQQLFKVEEIRETQWPHHINGKMHTSWSVDVNKWQDEKVIEYMIKLVE